MCDISKPTKRKTVTVYKTVIKEKGKYYSLFTGYPLAVGKVKEYEEDTGKGFNDLLDYEDGGFLAIFFNHNMKGRISGFKLKKDAVALATDRENNLPPVVVLKIVLTGNILRGTTRGIDRMIIPKTHTAYAGTEILSMEEIPK